MEACGYNNTSHPKYTNNIPQNKGKFYLSREDYKTLQNYFRPYVAMGDNYRGRRDTQQGGMRMRKRVKMKNNVNMRKRHRIQQPGFDVQRRGHK